LVSDVGFHAADFSRIRNLRQEDLAQVRIGEHVLTSPQDIAAICSTLRKTEWFESQHGGWAEELPLTFKTTTGREYSYRVAYYRVHPGAVILHRVGGPGGYMLGDVGFNAHLPDVLSRMGISLPGSA